MAEPVYRLRSFEHPMWLEQGDLLCVGNTYFTVVSAEGRWNDPDARPEQPVDVVVVDLAGHPELVLDPATRVSFLRPDIPTTTVWTAPTPADIGPIETS